VPDIVCVAKGIASGMPLGAIVARADVMQWPPGAHGTTFGGNPVACAAAIATIRLLEGGLIEQAARVGAHLRARLAALAEVSESVGDVRGMGLMLGVEIVTDRASNAPAPAERDRLVRACFDKGLLLLGCGPSTVRFCPPLVIDERDCDTAARIFAEALTERG
jgi:4-aminobutyrate aminotransferase